MVIENIVTAEERSTCKLIEGITKSANLLNGGYGTTIRQAIKTFGNKYTFGEAIEFAMSHIGELNKELTIYDFDKSDFRDKDVKEYAPAFGLLEIMKAHHNMFKTDVKLWSIGVWDTETTDETKVSTIIDFVKHANKYAEDHMSVVDFIYYTSRKHDDDKANYVYYKACEIMTKALRLLGNGPPTHKHDSFMECAAHNLKNSTNIHERVVTDYNIERVVDFYEDVEGDHEITSDVLEVFSGLTSAKENIDSFIDERFKYFSIGTPSNYHTVGLIIDKVIAMNALHFNVANELLSLSAQYRLLEHIYRAGVELEREQAASVAY